MEHSDEVVTLLRRIIRATDMRSKQLARESGLTPPQFTILQTIFDMGDVAISQIAREVNLTQATVTTIINKLENKKLVERLRSETDKRIVYAVLTAQGRKTLDDAPTLLQDQFLDKFEDLEDWEKHFIIAALQRVSKMMSAESLDASPFLDVGDITRTTE